MEDDRTPINELLKQLHTLGNSSDIAMDMSAQGEYLKIESQIITRIDDRIVYHEAQIAAHGRLDGYVLEGHRENLDYLGTLKGKIMKGVYNINTDTQIR